MMVTSSLGCGEFYILYIDLSCAHYADVSITQYIVYSMQTGPIYCIGPLFCVLECDIALAGLGYIILEHNSVPIFCI